MKKAIKTIAVIACALGAAYCAVRGFDLFGVRGVLVSMIGEALMVLMASIMYYN